MGRPSHSRALGLWMNGERVGEWRLPTRGPMELVYADTWLNSPAARPLSLSLLMPFEPVPLRTAAVAAYFDNLLPDNEAIRRRIAARFRVADLEPFNLLAEIGRDCVGALQLLPSDAPAPQVRRIDAEPLDDPGVERELDRALTPDRYADQDEDEFRISIAGAQEKTALMRHQGRWHRPHEATPTTHIFKLPLGLIGGQRQIDFRTSVDNEWLCLRLLRALGLPVPAAEIATFGRHRVLVVERFDRHLHESGTWWLRLPQEDLCQSLGVAPNLKYERDGGPGVVDILQTLQGSTRSGIDKYTFLYAQLAFWLLAGTDGHAKNFSVFLRPQGRFHLTPLYDVLSAWPASGTAPSQLNPHRMALAMGMWGRSKHRKLYEIQPRHFMHTADMVGLPAPQTHFDRFVGLVEPAIEEVLHDLPPDISQQVVERVIAGMRHMVQRWQASGREAN